MLKRRKNPESTYGSILIFVSTLAILFVAAFGDWLNHSPAQTHPKLFTELCIMLVTGVLLLFSKKNFIIGRIALTVLLILIAVFYTDMLIEALKESEKNNFPLFLYYGLFFVMNFMIILRVIKPRINKTQETGT